MVSEWYSIADISTKTGIPHQTVRRYHQNHKHLFKTRKHAKAYQLHEDCIDVLQRMRELYNLGKTQDQVNFEMSSSGFQTTLDVPNENGEKEKVDMGTFLTQLRDEMTNQGKYIQELTEALRRQSEENEKQQEYIRQTLEKRDQALIQSLREMQETKRLMLATKEDENAVPKAAENHENDEKPLTFMEKLKYLFK